MLGTEGGEFFEESASSDDTGVLREMDTWVDASRVESLVSGSVKSWVLGSISQIPDPGGC